MKPLKIDWDALEEAFSNQNEELVYYLDLVTGHVILEGEGEDDPSAEDDENIDPVASPVPVATRDATRVYIDPPDDELKLDWLQGFVADSPGLEPDKLERLQSALDAEDPTEAVRDVLGQHADLRDRWYMYCSDRVHEMIDRWIDEHSITVGAPPPWKA